MEEQGLKPTEKPLTDTPAKKRLTAKQRIFIEEYLRCWNASEAARRAGYRGAANRVGPRLLANVGIQEAIRARIAEVAMSADEILVRLADIARGSMEDFIRFIEEEVGVEEEIESGVEGTPARKRIDWVIDLVQAAEAGKLHLVKSIEMGPWGLKKIDLYDKMEVLALLGKHHRLFVERLEHTGKDGQPLPAAPATVVVYLPDNGRNDRDPAPEGPADDLSSNTS